MKNKKAMMIADNNFKFAFVLCFFFGKLFYLKKKNNN